MQNILIITNDTSYTFKFRKEIIIKLIKENYKVTILSNFSSHIGDIRGLGVDLIESNIHRRSINPIFDIKLYFFYLKILKMTKPSIVLTFTTKPNIIGAFAAKKLNISYIVNITGLGSLFVSNSILKFIIIKLYKKSLLKSNMVYFQNANNLKIMQNAEIKFDNYKIIPGSGVNLYEYNYLKYPQNQTDIVFTFVGRIMKAKGIDLFLNVSKLIKSINPRVTFNVLGFCEENYMNKLKKFEKNGYIRYVGNVLDVRKYLKETHCLVLPSYYPEGISNVLLEGAASGRPLITTNISGCKEVVDDGINGYLIEAKNLSELYESMIKFIDLEHNQKIEMGIQSRKLVENKFDRNKVVETYINDIKLLS
jgi:glycosyltransferase involved in cell wall biosynthesis